MITLLLSSDTPEECHIKGPITDGYKPPCGSWELNSGPLEEQSVLLTTEPSLQLKISVFQTKILIETKSGMGLREGTQHLQL